MSKQVKDLITKELTAKLGALDGVGVINPRGIDANKNNGLRRRLLDKGLRMTVVKNSLARRSMEGKKLQGFDKLLDGPSAVVYGSAASISRPKSWMKRGTLRPGRSWERRATWPPTADRQSQ